MSIISELKSQKYILLETYKKSSQPVKTPVWFVIKDDSIYIVTREKTGKVKRLKNNSSVKIAPCTFSGKPLGSWSKGVANNVSSSESKIILELRKKKYRFMEKLARLVTRNKGKLLVFSIKLNHE